jgi:hypothetical protein
MVDKLCKGDFPANRQIKDFLINKGYATEHDGIVDPTAKLTLQAPDNSICGGCTKEDKNGNVLIRINQLEMQKSDDHVAVLIGHELCHLMINNKIPNAATSPEVEALCDLIGLTAAKGAGFDVSSKVSENNRAYDPKILETSYKTYSPNISREEIEKALNNVTETYMPEKLNKIAEFVENKIPTRAGFRLQKVRDKLNAMSKDGISQEKTTFRNVKLGRSFVTEMQ